jgi:myo-inositol catabolism protein IolC
MNNLGYTKHLFILPFDHRSSFAEMLGFDKKNLMQHQKQTISSYKQIIYEAFKKSVADQIPKDNAAILVDEEYGDLILRDAVANGYQTILTAEKSGQKDFVFEYDDQFPDHIEKYKPNFVKALVRYHANMQFHDLKTLSDYCQKHNYKFLLEVITENKTSKEQIQAIKEFQNQHIEPDVWKLEGLENENEYQHVVSQAKSQERENVSVVVLGRGADKEAVEKWIASARIKGIIGFAIGRTIFWDPLTRFFKKEISREQTVSDIAKNYVHFYTLFTS